MNQSSNTNTQNHDSVNYQQLAEKIKHWGKALGFADVGICDIDLSAHEQGLKDWLAKNYHGQMDYMQTHGMKRARPNEILPGTLRVISVRMDYLPTNASFATALNNKNIGYISRYALGRDYHKVLRSRLKKLAEKIKTIADLNYRPFVDSAPIMERQLADNAGLGWTGKHSLLINQQAGSWFFIGELLIDIPLPVDKPVAEKCQSCVACLKICPTQAIVEPYVVDARRCISYLTIELKGAIPEDLRPLIGNRIYGCDDCQLICPWNRYAPITNEPDFSPRATITDQHLITLFSWNESTFLRLTEGSPIRRIGHQSWLRNIAVAMGNAPFDQEILNALQERITLKNKGDSSEENEISEMVQEHIQWAIAQQRHKQTTQQNKTDRLNARLISSIKKGLTRDA